MSTFSNLINRVNSGTLACVVDEVAAYNGETSLVRLRNRIRVASVEKAYGGLMKIDAPMRSATTWKSLLVWRGLSSSLMWSL
jgi:hypothetical protein